jgi:hypothetical protein
MWMLVRIKHVATVSAHKRRERRGPVLIPTQTSGESLHHRRKSTFLVPRDDLRHGGCLPVQRCRLERVGVALVVRFGIRLVDVASVFEKQRGDIDASGPHGRCEERAFGAEQAVPVPHFVH